MQHCQGRSHFSMCMVRHVKHFQTVWYKGRAMHVKSCMETSFLTRCGPVTQICVFTLQLCKTDDTNLRF